MSFNIQHVGLIQLSAWNRMVTKTYGRPYNLQQQDGEKNRGIFKLTVPEAFEEYNPDTIPVNGDEMGVSFAAWLTRSPNRVLETWWERHFYPDVQAVANDLHAKGLLPAGEYVINIDW